VFYLPGTEAVFTLFNLVFVVPKKRAIADEMEFQFDAVALVRIAPAAKNGGISLVASALPETPNITRIRVLNVVVF